MTAHTYTLRLMPTPPPSYYTPREGYFPRGTYLVVYFGSGMLFTADSPQDAARARLDGTYDAVHHAGLDEPIHVISPQGVFTTFAPRVESNPTPTIILDRVSHA